MLACVIVSDVFHRVLSRSNVIIRMSDDDDLFCLIEGDGDDDDD